MFGAAWWLACKHHQVSSLLKSITETEHLTLNEDTIRLRKLYLIVFIAMTIQIVAFSVLLCILPLDLNIMVGANVLNVIYICVLFGSLLYS